MKRFPVNSVIPLLAFSSVGFTPFGIPSGWDEIIVERALVDGVVISDSACDLSSLTVVDENAGYRVRQVGASSYVLREKRRRFYFDSKGDSLLWTGFEDRLSLSRGCGAYVLMNGDTGSSESDYTHVGSYSRQIDVRECGTLRGSSGKISLVMGGYVVRDAACVRTVRDAAVNDSLPLLEESLRIYTRTGAPAVEARRVNPSEGQSGWDEVYVLYDILINGIGRESPEQKEGIMDRQSGYIPDMKHQNSKIAATPEEVTVTFDVTVPGTDVEIIVCSLSGVVYRSISLTDQEIGCHSNVLSLSGLPQGKCLVIVQNGKDREKHLITID